MDYEGLPLQYAPCTLAYYGLLHKLLIYGYDCIDMLCTCTFLLFISWMTRRFQVISIHVHMYIRALTQLLHISRLQSCKYTVQEREPQKLIWHIVFPPGVSYLRNSSHRCPIYTRNVHNVFRDYIYQMASARLQRRINHVDFGVVCDPMCDA